MTLVCRCGRLLREKLWALGGRTYDDALRLHCEGRLQLPLCAPEIIAANAPACAAASGVVGEVDAAWATTLTRTAAETWVATDFETI